MAEPAAEQSYSREVPFQVAVEGQLRPRRNSKGEPNRPVITERNFSGSSLHAKLKTVFYGTYHGKPACLIVVQFVFFFQPGVCPRVKSADITISLENTHHDSTRTAPKVVTYSPRKVSGQVSEESRGWTFGIELLLGIPAVTILQPSVGVSHQTSYQRQHQMEIRGLPLSEDEGVRWSITENSKQKSGIPDIVSCAILAVYDGELFQAEVKIKIRTDSLFSIFANPWSKDDPVLLRPNASFGETRLDPQLERMTTEDWEGLMNF